MNGYIKQVEYALPERQVTNEEIAALNSKWTTEKILEKTGISRRHVADPQTTASDLAFQAASKIVGRSVPPETVDLLVFCTQSPDYVLPTTACILQERLGIPTSCAAFDFNQGCSGYIYGLSIVQSMIRAGQSRRALLLTGETYSKWMDPADFSVATIFGDAGTATLIDAEENETAFIGPFIYGTDGSGADRLIVGGSGARAMENDPCLGRIPEDMDKGKLFMDGPEIFAFTTRKIPSTLKKFLNENQWTMDDFDYVIFHQANKFMIYSLRKLCRITEVKLIVDMERTGNTVSNTIPIILSDMKGNHVLQSGDRLLLVGFGVGYSWGACRIVWK